VFQGTNARSGPIGCMNMFTFCHLFAVFSAAAVASRPWVSAAVIIQPPTEFWCDIWGFQSGNNSSRSLLGCNTV